MSAPAKILELVTRFEQHASDYRSETFNETQTRVEFINPLFKCLGWDVDNSEGRAERFKEIIAMPHRLGDVADIFVGLQTSADDVYIMDFAEETSRTFRLRSKALGREWAFEKDLLEPVVSGTDINRYGPLPNRQYILFPYSVHDEQPALIQFKALEERFPKTAAYLLENKTRLERRENGAFRDVQWHRFGRNQNLGIQDRIKLCVPRLVEELHASFDHDGSHFLDNVDVGGVTLKAAFAQQRLDYLLALLNCRLLRWYFPQVSAPFRGGWRSANRQFLSLLPIPVIDLKDPKQSALHGQLVGLVGSMQTLHTLFAAAKTPHDKTALQNQIAATDRQIDSLVYELYGLTEAEIGIVEGANQT